MTKMNINQKIKLLSNIEQGRFYLDLLDHLSDSEWREQYKIDTNLEEDHEHAKEIVYEERYHNYFKTSLKVPKDAEEISLKDIKRLVK
jgi:hypothetical protein